MSDEKSNPVHQAIEGCGCALIILAVGLVFGWSSFIAGVVMLIHAWRG
jgi:hypothetical protein